MRHPSAGWAFTSRHSSGERLPPLQEDGPVQAYLACIMEDGPQPQLTEVFGREAGPLPQGQGGGHGFSGVAPGIGVLGLHRLGQGQQHLLPLHQPLIEPPEPDKGPGPGGQLPPAEGAEEDLIGPHLPSPEPPLLPFSHHQHRHQPIPLLYPGA
ncbi:MAG: hypothetical protein KJ624_05860 [Chloroflexi bacterium]|nr:hypothetical protein [Chloroflexota bacterium]